jgi:hypothetical protein
MITASFAFIASKLIVNDLTKKNKEAIKIQYKLQSWRSYHEKARVPALLISIKKR